MGRHAGLTAAPRTKSMMMHRNLLDKRSIGDEAGVGTLYSPREVPRSRPLRLNATVPSHIRSDGRRSWVAPVISDDEGSRARPRCRVEECPH